MRIFTRTLFVLALLASSASAQYVKVEEADGTPKTTATKIILPNGTLSTAGSTATLTFSATAAYVYIAYASDASGTGFTTTFNSSLDYIAVKSTTSPIASPSASDFTGLWKNYKGSPGIDGSDGTNGTNGATWYRFATGTPTGGVDGDFAYVVDAFEVWYRSAGTWTLQGTLTEASTLTVTGAATVGSLVFEGATADANETTVSADDPTGDNDIRLPDKDGRLVAVELADTPAAGEVPTYQNDGTILWATPSGSSGYSESTTVLRALGWNIGGQTLGLNTSMITAGSSMSDGTVWLIPIYLKAGTYTGVSWYQSTQGVYTADNYNGVALYSYSAGTLTLQASSTNDGAIWSTPASNSWASKDWSSTYVVATDGVYWVGLHYNNSAATTAPSLGSGTALTNVAVSAPPLANSAKLFGSVAGQTSLPSSQAMSGVTAMIRAVYVAVY